MKCSKYECFCIFLRGFFYNFQLAKQLDSVKLTIPFEKCLSHSSCCEGSTYQEWLPDITQMSHHADGICSICFEQVTKLIVFSK